MLSCVQCRRSLALGAGQCSHCGAAVVGAALALHEGIRHFSEMRYDAALKEFKRARQIAPNDPDVARCYAHGLYHAGLTDEAQKHYRALLDHDRTDVEAQYNLGQILINQGRIEQARELFGGLAEASVAIAPDRFYLGLFFGDGAEFQADCSYYLAIACWNHGETEAAEHYFHRALGLNPAHDGARRHLANLYFQARDFARAVEHLEIYLKRHGDDPARLEPTIEVRCNLGIARLELGHVSQAIEQFHRVLRDRPGHPGAIYHMNLIYEREGRYAPLEGLSPARRQGPEDPPALSALSKGGAAERDAGAVMEVHGDRPIIGKALPMQRVLRLARLAAASDANVLITGENGTGKELIARAIHNNSARRDRVFMPVNCAAIPETLIESELFGHERGAFTGAEALRIGRFEAADKGTIFLDEIGELDLNMQVKLLRFIQEREFSRVGGTETLSVDVRLIAATNRDLERLLEEGLFRQDLFFRLNVLPIHVPPLRERVEDIPLLVDFFVEKYGKGSVRRESIVGEDDMRILTEYEWPGNIRELENVIERATVLGTQVVSILQGIAHRRRARERESPPAASGPRSGPSAPSAAAAHALRPTGWEPLTIRELERLHILRTLEYTAGKRSVAARLLGINPATLWRKMKTIDAGPPSRQP